jgi:NAD(P)-dependent dehydrogenase (short-subunit alcohol dehydrogenase family)
VTGVSLRGKAVVVTGATGGLGRAAAVAIADAGGEVVVNGRGAERLDQLVEEITQAGGRAVAFAGSIAEEAVAVSLVSSCVEAFGRIDCLINNAGVVRDRTTLRMTAEEFDDVMATNLRGVWLCGREAARAMRESGGLIVNVLSHAAFFSAVGQSNYAASKAGVAALTRAWAYELARYGIRANALCPVVLTEMTGGIVERAGEQATQEGKPAPTAAALGLGDAAEVAKVLVYLASDCAADLNAQILTFNGGRLAMWTHPRETEVRERESWTVAQIAEAFNDPGAIVQQELPGPDLRPLPGA